jgi:hypothetical protein
MPLSARRAARFIGLLFLLLPLTIASAPAPTQTPTLAQLSSDPYAGDLSQHQTQVEPDAASYGSTIVAAFQVGRYYTSGARNIGWATTQDAGASWTSGFLPGITFREGGIYSAASDPAVAYAAKHDTWLINSLALGSVDAIVVSPSTDGGITWGMPITVTAGGFVDKNWIACDNTPTSPFYGNCYTHWLGSTLLTSVSADGGRTWGRPRSTPSGAGGLGG